MLCCSPIDLIFGQGEDFLYQELEKKERKSMWGKERKNPIPMTILFNGI